MCTKTLPDNSFHAVTVYCRWYIFFASNYAKPRTISLPDSSQYCVCWVSAFYWVVKYVVEVCRSHQPLPLRKIIGRIVGRLRVRVQTLWTKHRPAPSSARSDDRTSSTCFHSRPESMGALASQVTRLICPFHFKYLISIKLLRGRNINCQILFCQRL